MTTLDAPAPQKTSPSDRRRSVIAPVCFAFCVAHAVYLIDSFVHGTWLIDTFGHGIATDFVNVWAAGRLVLDGQPAAAYDWSVHKAMEDAATGAVSDEYFAGLYPPTFLLVAAPLALLPYAAAWLAWMAASFSAFAAALRAITGSRFAPALAFAFPPALANIAVGQNGFLTAALIGGALSLLERQPVAAGCLLGLLTYKPQFGILFPLVLAASWRWRAIIAAAGMSVALAAASLILSGPASWEGLVDVMPRFSDDILHGGHTDWSKLQSMFSLVLALGGGTRVAWALQGMLSATTATTLCVLWRSRAPFDLKAAALAIGTVLATPYCYMYDQVILAIAIAFLFRSSRDGEPDHLDLVAIGCAVVLLASPSSRRRSASPQ